MTAAELYAEFVAWSALATHLCYRTEGDPGLRVLYFHAEIMASRCVDALVGGR